MARAVAASEYADLAAQITTQFLGDLEDAACLHDIGKACIPDAVLLKPGHLSASEFDIIRSHPVHGAHVFEQSLATSFGRCTNDIIRSHHEKWDGTGYPDGLSGEAIPLAARIVALADCYDALTTWRCYKAATSHERACEIIREASNTHFDPRLTQVFQSIASDIAL
ncbi:MAG: HD-GYP domain-containing protein [Chthoniobacterales bacterium]